MLGNLRKYIFRLMIRKKIKSHIKNVRASQPWLDDLWLGISISDYTYNMYSRYASYKFREQSFNVYDLINQEKEFAILKYAPGYNKGRNNK